MVLNKEQIEELTTDFKEHYNKVSNAKRQLEQLPMEVQEFIVDEISQHYKEIADKGLQVRMYPIKTAINTDKETEMRILDFSMKPDEIITKMLGKEGIGFYYLYTAKLWVIEFAELKNNKLAIQYLTKLNKVLSEKLPLTELITVEDYKRLKLQEKTPKPVKSDNYPNNNEKKPKDPNKCYICQNKPIQTNQSYPDKNKNLINLDVCLRCAVSKPNYIVQ